MVYQFQFSALRLPFEYVDDVTEETAVKSTSGTVGDVPGEVACIDSVSGVSGASTFSTLKFPEFLTGRD
jgi:hypothetical protein